MQINLTIILLYLENLQNKLNYQLIKETHHSLVKIKNCKKQDQKN